MKISIIIPVFNRENLVKDCLDSVLAQTYTDWECIVVDDGSTDNTWQVLQEYAAKDGRIKAFQRNREPKGAPTCRNIGWEKASSEHIIFMDSDDIMLSFCLKQRMDFVLKNDSIDFAIFPVFEKKKDIFVYRTILYNKDPLKSFLSFQKTWSTLCLVWNKKLLQQIGGWDENAVAWQDGEVHIRAMMKTSNYSWGSNIPDIYIRDVANNSITKKKSENKFIQLNNTHQAIYDILDDKYQNLFNKTYMNLLLNLIENQNTYETKLLLANMKNKSLISGRQKNIIIFYIFLYNSTKNIPIIKSFIYKLRSYGLIFPKRFKLWNIANIVPKNILSIILMDSNLKKQL